MYVETINKCLNDIERINERFGTDIGLAREPAPTRSAELNPIKLMRNLNVKWDEEQNRQSRLGGVEIDNKTAIEIECETKARINNVSGTEIRSSIEIKNGTRIESRTRIGVGLGRKRVKAQKRDLNRN
ncbi:hypothetical protein EVAR_68488_1 [Eumeta japonica]|uniref:Uncharacterized protein n=1 Tax=Eumeta variegata TaxID=151549 RepID=A0A4C2AG78_EUMVA|nr:hypothetical protein EVAR_68488_1 [Eumeta japonica]